MKASVVRDVRTLFCPVRLAKPLDQQPLEVLQKLWKSGNATVDFPDSKPMCGLQGIGWPLLWRSW
jgi:hypothetical protein